LAQVLVLNPLQQLNQRSRPLANQRTRAIKHWVRESLKLSEDFSVLVTELQCTEPGCPPLETVIALLGPAGRNTQVKIHRSLQEITKEEVVLVCVLLKHQLETIAKSESATTLEGPVHDH